MTVRIGSNIVSLMAQRKLGEAADRLGSIYERLASGTRITKASDDAAGLSIAAKLNASTRVYGQAIRNLNDGLSTLAVAHGALDELVKIATRQQELAEQAANGVYNTKQRSALTRESNALTDEYNRIILTTSFNGVQLLDGNFKDVRLQGGFGTSESTSVSIGQELVTLAGDGTFQAATTVSKFFGSGREISLVDVNGDGKLDLFTDSGAGDFELKFGNGDGTFSGAITGFGSGHSWSLADVNGDGRLDVIGLGSNAVTFGTFRLNTGNGTFAVAQTFAKTAPGVTTIRIASGDFNGDGYDDVAFGVSGGTQVLFSNGNGTFNVSATMSSPSVNESFDAFDMNNDGNLDIVNNHGVFYGQGNGTFSSFVTATVAAVSDHRIGDFNGDGTPDIVVGLGSFPRADVLLATGSGTFITSQTIARSSINSKIALGDVDGDGILDMIQTGGNPGQADIFHGNGNGTFTISSTSSLATTSNQTLALGDLNQDGALDLVTNAGASGVNVQLGNTRPVTTISRFDLSTQDGARSALESGKELLENLTRAIGTIGSYESRVQAQIRVTEAKVINYQTAESRIRDVDIADQSAELVRTQIIQQTAAAVLSQANLDPKIALQLLRGS